VSGSPLAPAEWGGPPGWRRGVLRSAGPVAPTVVKIGGSLLVRPDWPRLVSALVASAAPLPCLVVVGGGPVVDGLRAIDAAASRPAPLMHELAIDAMRLTARLVADALELPLIAEPEATISRGVLDVPAWLSAGGRAAGLPAGWGVTSDSIAARVAVVHGFTLVLAKSVAPPPCPGGLVALAAAGWVDDHFPLAADPLATIGWAVPEDARPA
jgi:hypothetical protein